MKRHFAMLVLFGSIASATSLFAQQRSGGPPPTVVQAPALTPAQQEEVLREAQAMLQRMRSAPSMPESERVNMLRELERSMVQLQRAQESGQRLQVAAPTGTQGQARPVIAGQSTPFDDIVYVGDGLNGGQMVVRRLTRSDSGTNAWWSNANLVARLGLTDDQKNRIERAFEASRQNLTTSRDQLEKEETQLSKLLAADSLDRGSIATQINRVVQARGEMERFNSLMTLEMRGVLTSAQWSQLQVQSPNAVVVVNPGIRGGGGQGAGQRGPAQAPAAIRQ